MGERTGDTLQQRIVAMILERGLEPGAPMPTEPRLMDIFDAGRNTVREAVRGLQALGIVEVRHGYGTFVGSAPLEVLTPSLAFWARSRPGGGIRALRELVEVRELIETGLIGRVAEDDVGPDRLAALDDLAVALEHDPEADRAFHARLYESAGNELVLRLIGLFWDVYRELAPLLDPPDLREIVADHRGIVDALRARDPAAAQEAMRRHFRDVKSRIARAEARAESP